jgi:hypothetical protein
MHPETAKGSIAIETKSNAFIGRRDLGSSNAIFNSPLFGRLEYRNASLTTDAPLRQRLGLSMAHFCGNVPSHRHKSMTMQPSRQQ